MKTRLSQNFVLCRKVIRVICAFLRHNRSVNPFTKSIAAKNIANNYGSKILNDFVRLNVFHLFLILSFYRLNVFHVLTNFGGLNTFDMLNAFLILNAFYRPNFFYSLNDFWRLNFIYRLNLFIGLIFLRT